MRWRVGLIVLAGLLAYSNSLSGPFIRDDVVSIVENRAIREWWHPRGVLFPERELPVAGRPLVSISFAVNYALGGLGVRGYHVWNVIVHLGCALLVFGVVRRTLALPGAGALRGVRPLDGGLAVALLWVLHPLNTEAVDYVTQRTETMMGLFYLGAVYASIRAGTVRSWRGWPAVAVATCASGMACKESMVTAPVMVALYDRVFLFPSIAKALRARWRLYVGLAATWLILAFLMSSGPRVYSAGFSAGVSPWTYLLNQAVMIVRYLRLAVWPGSLVLDYGWPLPLTVGDVLPQALIVVGLLAVTFVSMIRRPPLGFLGAWFFITLSPASSLVPIATEVGAERRMYLPLVALVALAVVVVVRLWTRVPAARHQDAEQEAGGGAASVPWALGGLLVAVSVVLAVLTMARHREYRSSFVLARTTLERYPTSFAHHGLAVELLAAGRRDEAMAHLRQAVPGAPRAHFTLGVELFGQSQWDEAIRELQAFVDAQPTVVEAAAARELLGRALGKRGRLPEAIAEYRAAVAMYSDSVQRSEVHRLWADALFAQRSFDEAVVHYRAYLELRPTDAAALTNTGIALGATNRLEEAIAAFRRAAEAEPQSAGAQRNLANALFDLGRAGDAEAPARQAVALRSDDSAAHDVLGRVFAVQGKVGDAIAEFEEAVRLDPASTEVREHLARVLQLRGASRRSP